MSFARGRCCYVSALLLLALCVSCESERPGIPICDREELVAERIQCYANQIESRQGMAEFVKEAATQPGELPPFVAKTLTENAEAPTLCARLKSPFEQASCRALTAIEHKDVELCREANAVFPTPSCLQVLAAEKCDASLCSEIKLHGPRDDCLAHLAPRCRAKPGTPSGDTAAECRNVADPETADDCWFAIATAKRTPGAADACLKIAEPGRRRYCARNYYPTARDAGVCALLDGKALQRACVSWLAQAAAQKAR